MRWSLPALVASFALLVTKVSGAQPPPDDEIQDADRARSETSLKQLLALLAQANHDANHRRLTLGVGFLVSSAAFATPSIYFAATGGESTRAADALSSGLLSVSLVSAVHGGVQLLGYAVGGPEHALYLDAMNGRGDPAATVARVETNWQREARSARDWRRAGGVLGLVGGALMLTSATVSILAAGPRREEYGPVGVMLAGGALFTLGGIHFLTSESAIETSYATWKIVKDTGEPRPWWKESSRPKPTFGVGPLPGGGLISAGFVF